MQKMIIGQSTNFYKPLFEAGGPARNSYELAMYLVSRGHNVNVYTTNYYVKKYPLVLNKWVNVDGSNVIYFENFRKIIRYTEFPIFSLKYLNKSIKQLDVLHIHEYAILCFFAAIFAKKHHVPYVFQARGSMQALYEKNIVKRIYSKYAFWMMQNADKVLALQEKEAKEYIEAGVNPDKIEIIPNGVNIDEYSKKLESGLFRKKYAIPEDTVILLYLARLSPTKGADFLINAYSEYKSRYPDDNTVLVLAGPQVSQEYETKLNQCVIQSRNIKENEILFTGPLFGEEKHSAFIDSDVYVFTTYLEGLPTSLLEACASGLPVITTNEANLTDVITRWKSGFIINHDYTQFAEKTHELVINSELRKKMSDAAKEMIFTEFRNEVVFSKIENVYSDIIKNKEIGVQTEE